MFKPNTKGAKRTTFLLGLQRRGEFGLLDVSWRSLAVGAICCAVVFPLHLFLAFLFRRSRVRIADFFKRNSLCVPLWGFKTRAKLLRVVITVHVTIIGGSIFFVKTKVLLWQTCVCCDKTCLVMTKVCLFLSRQTYFCHSKTFVATSLLFSRQNLSLVATKVCLSRQTFAASTKIFSWQT